MPLLNLLDRIHKILIDPLDLNRELILLELHPGIENRLGAQRGKFDLPGVFHRRQIHNVLEGIDVPLLDAQNRGHFVQIMR